MQSHDTQGPGSCLVYESIIQLVVACMMQKMVVWQQTSEPTSAIATPPRYLHQHSSEGQRSLCDG